MVLDLISCGKLLTTQKSHATMKQLLSISWFLTVVKLRLVSDENYKNMYNPIVDNVHNFTELVSLLQLCTFLVDAMILRII